MTAIDDIRERDDIEAVLTTDHVVYLWINRSIGNTGDIGPSLLRDLARVSDEGHGVFPGFKSRNPPTLKGSDRTPDLHILRDWRD